MKILRYLLVGGVLTLGAAMARDAPKPETHTSQTKAKKHHKHKKTTKTMATPPANAAPVNLAHRK
jgi:hypothetical protein